MCCCCLHRKVFAIYNYETWKWIFHNYKRNRARKACFLPGKYDNHHCSALTSVESLFWRALLSSFVSVNIILHFPFHVLTLPPTLHHPHGGKVYVIPRDKRAALLLMEILIFYSMTYEHLWFSKWLREIEFNVKFSELCHLQCQQRVSFKKCGKNSWSMKKSITHGNLRLIFMRLFFSPWHSHTSLEFL